MKKWHFQFQFTPVYTRLHLAPVIIPTAAQTDGHDRNLMLLYKFCQCLPSASSSPRNPCLERSVLYPQLGQRRLTNRPTAKFASWLINRQNMCPPAVLRCESHCVFSLFSKQAVYHTPDQLVSLHWALLLGHTHTHVHIHTQRCLCSKMTGWEIKGCKVEVVPSLASLLTAWLGFL